MWLRCPLLSAAHTVQFLALICWFGLKAELTPLSLAPTVFSLFFSFCQVEKNALP